MGKSVNCIFKSEPADFNDLSANLASWSSQDLLNCFAHGTTATTTATTTSHIHFALENTAKVDKHWRCAKLDLTNNPPSIEDLRHCVRNMFVLSTREMPWCLDTLPKKLLFLKIRHLFKVLFGRILKVEVFNELFSAFSMFPAWVHCVSTHICMYTYYMYIYIYIWPIWHKYIQPTCLYGMNSVARCIGFYCGHKFRPGCAMPSVSYHYYPNIAHVNRALAATSPEFQEFALQSNWYLRNSLCSFRPTHNLNELKIQPCPCVVLLTAPYR